VDLPADLHADHQEEDGHQAIVDPEVQGLGEHQFAHTEGHRHVPEGFIAGGNWRVRPPKRSHGHDQQDNAADGFDMEKTSQGGEGAFGEKLGTRQGMPCRVQ